MRISVAMTTFNGAKHLKGQLDSLLSQTRQPDEIVICDDCSQDTTLEILKQFKEKAAFEVVIFANESTLGVSRNFEKAISNCVGDIIFICDQDDVWKSEKIENILEYFLNDEELLILVNDAIIVDENLISSEVSILQQTQGLTGNTNEFIHGCCTAFRRTLRDLSLPFPRVDGNVVGYDGWLHNVGGYLGARRVIPISYQYYRRHLNNVSDSIFYSTKHKDLKDRFLYFAGKFLFFVLGDSKHYKFLENNLDNVILLRERLNHLDCSENDSRKVSHIDKLNTLEKGLCFRTRIAKIPRISRFFPASWFYFSGGYRSFSGYKSFLVDVLKSKY